MGFKLIEKILLIAWGIGMLCIFFLINSMTLYVKVALPIVGASYLLFSWYLFPVEAEGKTEDNKVFSALSGAAFCVFIVGVLFRIFRWHGHLNIFYPGLIATIVIWTYSTYMKNRSDLKLYYGNISKRSAVFMMTGMILIALHQKAKHDKKLERERQQTESSQNG